MKVCFTSDFHGQSSLFDQLNDLVRAQRPDLLILGGDMLPDGDPVDPPRTQAQYVRATFAPLVAGWAADYGTQIAAIPGNHDWLAAHNVLIELEKAKTLKLLTLSAWHFGEFHWLGYGYSPPTPWWVKDFERLDTADDKPPAGEVAVCDPIHGEIRRMPAEAYFHKQPCIDEELSVVHLGGPGVGYVMHAPPYDSKLDRLPHLDQPIGSKAVRRLIERTQPAVALHGHIHESPHVTGTFVDRIGKTLCINPGQSQDRLHAVLFDVPDIANSLRHTVLK